MFSTNPFYTLLTAFPTLWSKLIGINVGKTVVGNFVRYKYLASNLITLPSVCTDVFNWLVISPAVRTSLTPIHVKWETIWATFFKHLFTWLYWAHVDAITWFSNVHFDAVGKLLSMYRAFYQIKPKDISSRIIWHLIYIDLCLQLPK